MCIGRGVELGAAHKDMGGGDRRGKSDGRDIGCTDKGRSGEETEVKKEGDTRGKDRKEESEPDNET